MRYCKKCVMPDTRPYMKFNEEGVCYPCIHYENRKNVDWDARWKELEALADKHRGRNGNYYDVIITASGGKDSHYQVDVFKEKLNMNPLLVSIDNFSWTKTGRENYENLGDRYGVDIHLITLNRKVARRMLSKGLDKGLYPTWIWDRAVYAYPLQMAIKLNIPLVIWGENTAYERGGPILEDTPDAMVQLKNDVVKPIPLEEWVDEEITLKDLNPIIYPSMEEIEKAGVEARFLSYYDPWSDHGHYEYAIKNGWKTLEEEWVREGLPGLHYLQVDTIGYLVHNWVKFVKMGHWALTDYCSLDIREGRMTREEAVKLINQEEYKLDPKMLKDFLDFTGVSEERFWALVDKFANKDIVEKRNGIWRLKQPLM
ncbi:N-acetyl sugar amidotransferase [Candidatus Heimdallarchaeota archaeon B3_Heim]|nr:MAG: N-acetyl sugar amidotransferase [Candidatus Heimdallarchaeota archaeon B3_Heim]